MDWIVGLVLGLALLGCYSWLIVIIAVRMSRNHIIEELEQAQREVDHLEDMWEEK